MKHTAHISDERNSAKPGAWVPHPFQLHRKGWGIALRATAFVGFAIAHTVNAQTSPCQLTAIRSSPQFRYPEVASLSHINGVVQIQATFAPDGKASGVQVISGIELLSNDSARYVSGWSVNESTAGQTCLISFSFTNEASSGDCLYPESTVTFTNLQHFTVNKAFPCIEVVCSDPAFNIHRVLFFKWRTKPAMYK